jgi:cytochrome b561
MEYELAQWNQRLGRLIAVLLMLALARIGWRARSCAREVREELGAARGVRGEPLRYVLLPLPEAA